MKLRYFSALLATIIIASTAAGASAKDRSTNPESYFLLEGEAPNSLKILPPPPAVESVAFLYDKARYDWGKSLRGTERGEQAVEDARLGGDGVARAFSEAFGVEISSDQTPQLYRLLAGMREDAGELATRDAKEHYNRQRPFAFFGENTCNPEQQQDLAGNGSYPSGHTSIGWATALVLTEINPERADEILKRGYEIGDSRVICGYHYQSDVDAGRITGASIVARLHADTQFLKQLDRAKKEFAALKKAGRVKPAER